MLTGERWRRGGDLYVATMKLLLLGLWLGGLALTAVTIAYYATGHRLVGDAHAYWLTGRDWYVPYVNPPDTKDAYLYSPAFAQLIAPVTWLAWPVFATLWVTAESVAFCWLLRPLGWTWTLPLLLWCSPELVIGNVLGFEGVAVVLAVTRPSAWTFGVLTKPTFGIGLLWFAIRREWGRLFVGCVVPLTVTAASLLWAPAPWIAWIGFMVDNANASTFAFPVRLVAAVLVVGLAARTNRPWLLAVALVLATPVFAGSPSLTVLAAVPRLLMATTASRGPSRRSAVPRRYGERVVPRPGAGSPGRPHTRALGALQRPTTRPNGTRVPL